MGARGSTLIGKAQPDSRLLPFTSLDQGDMKAILDRHRHDLGGAFALGPKQFAMLLNLPSPEASSLFKDVFDTDRNSLVDSFEAIGALAMLSKMSISQKVSFVYSLYDFNGSGDITLDEMTILMKTLVSGCAKMDPKISPPSTEEVERLAAKAFSTADKDADGEISKHEFDSFCFHHPMCKDFLDYWRGAMNQAVLAEEELYTDTEFSPSGSSLYTEIDRPPAGMPPQTTIEWLRPKEFCPDSPVLFTPGPAAGSLKTGSIANKWFASALAIVASKNNGELVKKLFVNTGQESHGRYCVRFFKEGTWLNAVVDDQLPFNHIKEPLFISSVDRNEIYAMLVEKAYAKVHGNYECLIGGSIEYALKDLTGGSPEAIDTNSDPKFTENVEQGVFWAEFKKKLSQGIVGVACAGPEVRIDERGEETVEDRMGIEKGYAYPVLGIVEVQEKRLKLVKVGNPWDGLGEWKGDWGADSALWEEHPDVSRTCKRQVRERAFWMTERDFVKIFNMHYFCRITDEDTWQTVRFESEFPVKGGGCFNFPSWVQNDQILLDVEDDTEVIISVTQQDDRLHKDEGSKGGKKRPCIGVAVHKHEFTDIEAGGVAKLLTVNSVGTVLRSPFADGMRDSVCSGKLDIGRYVVVPQTFDPNSGNKYWITIQSKERINVFAGAQIEWEEGMDNEFLEGNNEMEEDISKTDPEAVDSDGSTSIGKSYEVDSRDAAVGNAAKMIAQLTVLARQLEQKKLDLTKKLEGLEAQVEALTV